MIVYNTSTIAIHTTVVKCFVIVTYTTVVKRTTAVK